MFNFLSKALNFGTKIDLSLQIIGSLQLKEIGAQIIELSPECKLQIQQDNQNEFSLLLTNTENVDNWENLSFQISFDRHFKKYVSGINTCLLWEKNQTFYIFEILVDVENKNNTEPFFDNLSQILEMLEGGQKRKYYIDNYDEIEDIDAFLEQNYQHYRINETSKAVDDLSSGIGNIKVSYPPIPQRIKEAKLIFRAPGEFYDYNQGDDEIKLLAEKCFFCIYLMNITEYEFGLSVEKDDTLISYDVFTPSTSYQVTKDCFLWLSHSDNFNTKAVSFIFEDKLLLEKLKTLMIKIHFETANKMEYDNIPSEDREWLERENTKDESYTESEDTNVEMTFDDDYQEKQSQIENKFVNQAFVHDRTFCIKNNNTISVYKTNEDTNSLDLLMNLPPVQQYNGKEINLKKGQMFRGDTNILFLDKNNPNLVYQYDIPKSEIVSEWSIDTGTSSNEILSIAPEKKMDQMTDAQIIYGMNNNSIFALDGRLNKQNKLVDLKSYKTNPLMSCIASSGIGGFATGSLDGQIRLYDEIGKNAKNVFRGYGDPIKGIDITENGKYVLATCDWYLLLFCTVPKNSNTNGFITRLTKNKPSLKTLKIHVHDIEKYKIDKDKFTPAKFNISKDGETNIITSLGEYVVIWNFTKIKKGILDDYKIQKVNQFVIDNQFKYNKNQVVITMPNLLRVQNQKQI